jgi:hypothetical protein
MSFIDRVRPSPLYTNLLDIQFGSDLASPSGGAGRQIQQSIRVLAARLIEHRAPALGCELHHAKLVSAMAGECN